MSAKSKYDLDLVRQTASGNWINILSQLAGLPSEVLDSKPHPCPIGGCGGTDRFRAFDDVAQTGGIICNQCIGKCSDGFAALEKITGLKFIEVVEKVATYCGVKPRETKQNDPIKDLDFQPWSSQLVQLLLAKKPGITEQAMLAAGAKLAKYKGKYTVYAFPVIGQDLNVDAPVGWLLLDFQGNPLPVWDKDGNVVRTVKMKLTSGSKPGLLGVHGCERMKVAGLVQRVRKVEGLTDLLCLWSQQPESERDSQIILSTANGSMETPRWQASTMASYDVDVIHDADEPGQVGAATWSQAIALQQSPGRTVRNVKLPYEIEPTHGKDLRDFFNDANTWRDFEALIDKAEVKVVKRTEGGEVDPAEVEFGTQELIMKKLQIEVMEEDQNNKVRIFSTFLRKSSIIPVISRLKLDDLILYCGAPAAMYVTSTADGADHQNTFSIGEVRRAIALTASTKRGDESRKGVGVWQGVDKEGNETSTIVLVNNTEAARWNGDKVLRRVLEPRVDGLVLDYGAGQRDWFNFDELERNLKNAESADWAQDVIDQSVELFSRWKWKNPTVDPWLLTGLVMASWVQTIWEWRPLVSLSGKTNSGKSYLYHAIGGKKGRTGIFNHMVYRSAKSTEPGIRQNIGNTAKVIMCDEFEKSHDRDLILEKIFRPSTRGDSIGRGSSSQKGTSTDFQHLGWVTATETGLTKRPDLNRFIQFFLIMPPREEHGKLVLPEGSVLQALGQKLLSLAVSTALAAKQRAVRLKSCNLSTVDPRIVEGYAVPAAILSTALQYDEAKSLDLLEWLVSGVDSGDQEGSDEEDLLDAILSAQVFCGAKDGNLSVSQILSSPAVYSENAMRLESVGIGVIEVDNGHALFVDWRQITRTVLRNSQWEGKRLDNVLEGLPGAYKARKVIGGRKPRGVVIPKRLYDIYASSEPEVSEYENNELELQTSLI